MNVLLVDDDPLVSATLRHFLEKAGGVTSVVAVTDGVEALKALAEQDFDAVFLDLEMPEVDGVSVLKTIHPDIPVVVVSARSDFAAESYDYNVADYLVKPVEFARFHKALQRVQERVKKEGPESRPAAPVEKGSLMVREGGKLVKVNLARLLFLKAESNYTQFVTADRSFLALVSLKQLEDALPAEFMRIQRSYIVNVKFIEVIDGPVVRVGTHVIPVGEAYRVALLERFTTVN